jgi:hypothetical protein
MANRQLSLSRILIIVGSVLVVGIIGIVLLVRSFLASGITAAPDQQFGDQHLKTAVALIELHKVRYGRYPASLQDLTYTGTWDQIAVNSVRYYPNTDGTRYYLEVERGWVGKPALTLPDGFWQGTGYDPTLKPSAP